MVRALQAAAAAAALALVGCGAPPVDPLLLDGNRLTVDNRTSDDWTEVEIWLNYHFRVTTPRIAAGSRFTAPLDTFVEAYGRRFSFNRMQITDLRLTAKKPDGQRFELKKQFLKGGLAGALGGKS